MSYESRISTYQQSGCCADTFYFYNKKIGEENDEIDPFVTQVNYRDYKKAGVQVHNWYSLIGLISWLFNCATYVKSSGLYVSNSSMSKLMVRMCNQELSFTRGNYIVNKDTIHTCHQVKIDQREDLPEAIKIFKSVAKNNSDKQMAEIFKLTLDAVIDKYNEE